MYKQIVNSFLANGPVEHDNALAIHKPFAHRDIERIQNALCIPGVHYLKFENVLLSHLMLNTSLRYSNKIVGHLSVFHQASSLYIDLYSLFLNKEYDSNNFDEFFIDYSHIELLWIERSTSLLTSPWIPLFEKNIIDFNIQNTIPIIITYV